MRSLLTIKVESILGAILVVVVTGFFLSKLWGTISDFNAEVDIQTSNSSRLKSVSLTEQQLIQQWANQNGIQLPPGDSYRYLIRVYPDRPWLSE